MLTHSELKEKVSQQIDEVTLLDILEITSEQLVEVFSDELEEKREKLMDLLELEEDLND